MAGAPENPVAILIGPPGVGKTTIGRRLAKSMRVPFTDTDFEIERCDGRQVGRIFAEDGEAAFRILEERVIADVVAREHGVIALGGGAIMSPRTRALLRQHQVVYLELTEDEGIRRTAGSGRPLLAGEDPAAVYRRLMAVRTPIYKDLATIRVSTVGRPPATVVRQVQRRLGDTFPRRVRRAPWPNLPSVLRPSARSHLPADRRDSARTES
jgi:shikimate kinase